MDAGIPFRLPSDRYRIERELGHGGMGQVFLAQDTLLDRPIALKRLLTTADTHHQRSAILREARRASRINHRHIAAIYDVLDLGDQVVLVMEYVDGATLRTLMSEGVPLPIDTFRDLAGQCLEGITAAHAQGVIHRDIKPENLMVTRDGQIKFLDFGIARRAPGADGITSTTSLSGDASDTIAGTPQYMAPEALLGGAVDERTDLFALGAVFYEMLTGRRPFAGDTFAAIVDRVLNSEPPAVDSLNPEAGPAISAVIARMLAKNPAMRFASSSEISVELTTPGRIPAPRAGRRAATPRPVAWRAPALAAAALLVAVAAVLSIRARMASAVPDERNVVVLAPHAGAGDFSAFATGAADLLSTRLRRQSDTPGVQVASFTQGVEEGASTPAEARRILGVNLALVPTFEQRTDAFVGRMDLIECATGRVIATRRFQAPASRPFDFLDEGWRAATAMLRLETGDAGTASVIGIRGAGTLRFYLQGLGRVRSKTESEVQRAIEDLQTACRTEPEAATPRALLAAAQLALQALNHDPGLLAQSEATAREAIALDSGRVEPHRALGGVFIRAHRDSEAIPVYERVTRLDPTDSDSRFALSRMYGRTGHPDREKEIVLAEIARKPHRWQPWWWLASWEYRQGNVDPAIRAFEQMIARAPGYEGGYSRLGGLLILNGRYAAAIDTLRIAIALRPTRAAFDNLGTAYFNSGRLTEAIDAYNQSFQFGDADYLAWMNLGDAYYWLRDRKDRAAGAYAQAIRLGREQILDRVHGGRSPDYTIPSDLGAMFARLGQLDSARVYLHRALSADSANPKVQMSAALTYWELGEHDRAVSWLGRSIRGGYPIPWVRDSPMFDAWRTDSAFRTLVPPVGRMSQQTASRS